MGLRTIDLDAVPARFVTRHSYCQGTVVFPCKETFTISALLVSGVPFFIHANSTGCLFAVSHNKIKSVLVLSPLCCCFKRTLLILVITGGTVK